MRILHLNNQKTWRGGQRQTLLLAVGRKGLGSGSVIACRPDGPSAHAAHKSGKPLRAIPGNNLGTTARDWVRGEHSAEAATQASLLQYEQAILR